MSKRLHWLATIIVTASSTSFFSGCGDLQLLEGPIAKGGRRADDGTKGSGAANGGSTATSNAGATSSSGGSTLGLGGALSPSSGGHTAASGGNGPIDTGGGNGGSGGAGSGDWVGGASNLAGAVNGGNGNGTTGNGATGNGGAAQGGSATAGASNGGAAAAGTSSAGNAGVGNTGAAGAGAASGQGSVAGAAGACPNSKPFVVRASEPQPADPCARVSVVTKMNESNLLFGFTNGEIWRFNEITDYGRADVSIIPNEAPLPRAMVSVLASHRDPESGSAEVGYVDAQGVLSPWHTGMLGRAWWSEWRAKKPGTALSIFSCPFHTSATEHRAVLTTPGALLQESVSITEPYAALGGSSSIARHMGLGIADEITSVDVFRQAGSWKIYAGGRNGRIVRSQLISQAQVLWDDVLQQLNYEVKWEEIGAPSIPNATVLRITVHPTNSSHLFAVLERPGSADALWFSNDEGDTWQNRHGKLPTTSSVPGHPALIGVSFHPKMSNVAYVVTPTTVFYTTDYGQNWQEW